MLKLLADENFDNTIVRGLLRRQSSLDIVRVQDVGLSGKDDPSILAWAANENRILLTHDVATITHFAYERIIQGLSMPGVIEVRTDASIKKYPIIVLKYPSLELVRSPTDSVNRVPNLRSPVCRFLFSQRLSPTGAGALSQAACRWYGMSSDRAGNWG